MKLTLKIVVSLQARSQGGGPRGPRPPPNRSAPEICTVIKQLPLTGPIVYFVLYLTFYV